MSTDYRFKITKKSSDGIKKAGDTIAEFWYNRIKNVAVFYTRDMELHFDPEKFPGESSSNGDGETRPPLTMDMLESDISKVKAALDMSRQKLAELELKLLLVKEGEAWDRLKEEQRDLKQDIEDRTWAWQSLEALQVVIETLVEDMVSQDSGSVEDPCSKDCVWARDVLIFPTACW